MRGNWSSPGLVSRVALGLALPQFPQHPPRKYQGNNTIDIDLTFDLINEFRVDGVADYEPGRVELVRTGPKGVRLTFVNDSAKVEIASELVRVATIRSYVYDPFAPPI